MQNEEFTKKIEEMSVKIDEISNSVRQLKNYFKWVLIITIAMVVFPLIGLMFAIPSYLNTLNTITSF